MNIITERIWLSEIYQVCQHSRNHNWSWSEYTNIRKQYSNKCFTKSIICYKKIKCFPNILFLFLNNMSYCIAYKNQRSWKMIIRITSHIEPLMVVHYLF